MSTAKIAIAGNTNGGMPHIDVPIPAGGINLMWTPQNGKVDVAAGELEIPVTHARVAKTTGSNAETLTLADGKPGQVLTIDLVVDGGGTGTLTPTTKSGFTNIPFADAGDQVTLRYVDDTVGWVIIGAAGVTAPPAIAIT